jgi:formamidopyrimidine-DNA glycosylase
MPELPEVETVCRNLRAAAAGARILQLRLERPGIARPQTVDAVEQAAAGRTLERIERRGKNILLHLDNDTILHIHLRMTGNLYVVPDVRFRPVSVRAWCELEGGRGILFDDPRALGRIHIHPASAIDEVLGVGVEPLSDAFTAGLFQQLAAGSRQPAKLFLMDQRHIAGLGNIYAAEALFRARVNPEKPIGAVQKAKLRALHQAIRDVLEEAVASALLAYATPGRFNEAEEFPCAVYDREGEPCTRCRRAIRRIPQGGRSTYYCPGCQR